MRTFPFLTTVTIELTQSVGSVTLVMWPSRVISASLSMIFRSQGLGLFPWGVHYRFNCRVNLERVCPWECARRGLQLRVVVDAVDSLDET